jgi:hypothetical protein
MKIDGWKTRSVFERYAFVSQSDIRGPAGRGATLQALGAESFIPVSTHIESPQRGTHL